MCLLKRHTAQIYYVNQAVEKLPFAQHSGDTHLLNTLSQLQTTIYLS